MKTSHFLAGLLLAALIVASCSMPQESSDDIIDQLSANDMFLSVETETSRNQGVYVNEKGDKFDIVSQEGPDGTIVRCVEAVDIFVVSSRSSAKSVFSNCPVKALVLGRRDDGFPGVWEIHHDDSIHPVENEQGVMSSKMAETAEVEWVFHSLFGWEYYVHPEFIGPDDKNGYIVVGYAENKDGFSLGRHKKWAIPAGTKVAVYWRVHRKKLCGFLLNRARIIGEPAEEYKQFRNKTGENFGDRPYRLRRFPFGNFRLNFLNYFEIYLKMPDFDQVRYDDDRDIYIVPGVVPGDPVDKPAIAEIDLRGEISIELIGMEEYNRVVFDTYHPDGQGWLDTYITVYEWNEVNQQMNFIAEGDEGHPNRNMIGYAFIDYKGGLTAGTTYYIKVNMGTGEYFNKDYCLRVLALNLNDPLPPIPPQDKVTEDTYETEPPNDDDEVDSNEKPKYPVIISLDTPVMRFLDTPDDIDWFELTLP